MSFFKRRNLQARVESLEYQLRRIQSTRAKEQGYIFSVSDYEDIVFSGTVGKDWGILFKLMDGESDKREKSNFVLKVENIDSFCEFLQKFKKETIKQSDSLTSPEK